MLRTIWITSACAALMLNVSCQEQKPVVDHGEPALSNLWDMTCRIAFKYAWAIERLKTAQPEQRRQVIWRAAGIDSNDIIPILVLAMNDSDPEVVRSAIYPFTYHVRAGQLPARFFLRFLDHAERSVRGYAALAITFSKDPSVCDALAGRIQTAAGDDKVSLAIALGTLGDGRALDVLLDNLGHSQAAVYALGYIKAPQVVPKLIEVLRQNESDGYRWAASEGLARQGDRRAVPALIKALEDPSLTVVEQSAKALGKLGGPESVAALMRLMKGPKTHPNARSACAWALDKAGDPAAVPVLTGAFDEDPKWIESQTATAALAALAPRNLQPVLQGLKSGDGRVRRHCAAALGMAGERRAAAALIEMLQNDNSVLGDDACAAANALGKLGAPSAVGPLIAKLTSHRNIRWSAARALGKIRDPRSIVPLIEGLLTDKEEGCLPGIAQLPYLEALATIGKPAAEAVVRRLRNGPELTQRLLLVEALGHIGSQVAVPELMKELSGDEALRRAAASSLCRIGDPETIETLASLVETGDESVRREAAQALAEIGGPRAADELFRLSRRQPWVCLFLAYCNDPRAPGLLLNYMRTASQYERLAAERELGRLQVAEAVKDLVKSVQQNNDRDAATALGEIGGSEAVEGMLAALEANPQSPVEDALRKLAVPVK